MDLHSRRSLFAPLLAASMFLACSSSAADDGMAPEPGSPSREGDAGAPAAEPGGAAEAAPDVETPNETGGARLKPYYQQTKGSDGSVMLRRAGWYDAERDEHCGFQTLADGKLHCAPYGEEPAMRPEEFFQDAACAMPVIGFSSWRGGDTGASCAAPSPPKKRYVRIVPPYGVAGAACAAPKLAAFPTSGRLAVTTVYRKLPSGACEAYPLDGIPTEVFAAPSPLAEIDPASFATVTAADETPATGGRLRKSHTRWSSADGMRAISDDTVVDTQRNEFCWGSKDRNGQARCMPSAASVNEYGFADAQCSRTAWSVSRPAECFTDARRAAGRYMAARDTCSRAVLYPRVTSSSLSTLYFGTPAACTAHAFPAGGSPGYVYIDSPLPPPIDPTSFVALSASVEDAPAKFYSKKGSRLVPRMRVDKAGSFSNAFALQLFDPEIGDFCQPTTLEDGKAYCVGAFARLSIGTSSPVVYGDAACTVQVVGVSKGRPECKGVAPEPVRKFLADRPYDANGCETLRLFEAPATKAAVTALYQRNSAGACVPSYDASAYDLYRVADLKTVAPSRFVEVDVAIVRR